MSWYSFRPYVSVAQRRAQGRRRIKELQAKGRVIEPLGELSHRGKIATSFWGAAWCRHLESFSDYENRLPRGRTYVRNGSVLHLEIRRGTITALVQGSELYEQTIRVNPLPKITWTALQARCRGRIGTLIELLQGRISSEIMGIVTSQDDGLFPKPNEIKLACSCPDSARLCKHIAAILYGVGARLDSRPELLFTLRGVDHNDLIAAAATGAAIGESASATGRPRRTLDPKTLADVFGIDLDSRGRPAAAVPAKPKASPTSRKSAPRTRKAPAPDNGATPDPNPVSAPFTPTASSVRALRARLDLTRAEFAAVLGVSPQSIANWEAKSGPLRLHEASLEGLIALHSLQ